MPKLLFKEGHNCMASSDYDTSEHNIIFYYACIISWCAGQEVTSF